jgi:hypothetical protein
MSEVMEQSQAAVEEITFPRDENGLIVVDQISSVALFHPGNVRKVVAMIEAAAIEAAKSLPADMSVESNRQKAKSLAFKIARSKSAIDEMGKSVTEGWRKATDVINDDRKFAVTRLDALRDRLKAAAVEYEAKEKARQDAHEDAITDMGAMALFDREPTSNQVAERSEQLTKLFNRDWEEYTNVAGTVLVETREKLAVLKDVALKREQDRADLQRLRQLEAERIAAEQAAQEKAAAEARDRELQARAERMAEELAAKKIAEAQAEEATVRAIRAADTSVDAAGKTSLPPVSINDAGVGSATPPRIEPDIALRRAVHLKAAEAISRAAAIGREEGKSIVAAIVNKRIPGVSISYEQV